MANADTSNIEDAVVRATHEILTKPDWSANIGICDWLKRRPSHIPQALRVILSRLKHKQLSVQNHTIELLATLMKNCSDVRVHIAQPDFLKAFVSKVPKKIREPNARFVLKTKWSMQEKSQYDRILVLVKTWARELGSHSRGRPFREIYDQLKATGCKFPSLMEKGMEGAGARVSSGNNIPNPPPFQRFPKALRSGGVAAVQPSSFSDRECRTAMETYVLLEEMLSASEPTENLRRHELIQNLVATVVANQKAISRRVTTTGNPSVLDELLRANDSLIWVIKYYHGLVNGTMQRIKKTKKKPANSSSNSNKGVPHQPSMDDGDSKRRGRKDSEKKNRKSRFSSSKKKKDTNVPSAGKVSKLKKKWLSLRKEWREDKSDKALRKEMRAAKKAYEAAKEAYEEAEDEDEEEEEEEDEEPRPAAGKKNQPKTSSRDSKFRAPEATLFNLAPPPGDGVAGAPSSAAASSSFQQPPPHQAPQPVVSVLDFDTTATTSTAITTPAASGSSAPAAGGGGRGGGGGGGEDLSDPFAALALRHSVTAAPTTAGPNQGIVGNQQQQQQAAAGGGVNLMDLFGNDATPAPSQQQQQQQPAQFNNQQPGGGNSNNGGDQGIDLMGIFG
eukprot:jgi/Bigna1/140342/aug1.55_g15050